MRGIAAPSGRLVSPPGAWRCIVLLALWCTACLRTASDDVTASPKDTLVITGDTLYAAADLAIPTDIALVGRHVVVLDIGGDSAVRVLRSADGGVVRTFGKRGKGPGEFREPWSLDALGGVSDVFWVYDMDLARLTRIDLAGPFDASGRNRWPVVLLQTAGHFNSPQWISDDRILSPGVFTHASRLAELDERGRLLRFIGSLPPGEAATPMMVRQHAYIGKASFNRERGLLALGSDHADRIEIYKPDGTLLHAWHGPANFEPSYRVAWVGGTPVFDGTDELRFGYVDITTTRDGIFALFSGRTRKEFGRVSGFGEEVHVYTWSGRLEKVIRLDSAPISIAISSDGHALYASVIEPTPTILRYRLP